MGLPTVVDTRDPRATLYVGDCRDVLASLPDGSAQCCVTSPPYWGLRDYGVEGQLGLEPTPEEYVSRMVEVFREVRRVLRPDGTLWLNLGDCYATGGGSQGERWRGGHEGKHGRVGPMTQPNRMPIPGLKPKDLVGIPWRVAFALHADGWYMRSDIIWHKPNPMPESVIDRPTKAHEYVFLLTKSEWYVYDADALREPHASPGRKRGASALQGQAALRPRGNLSGEADYHPLGRNARSVWSIAKQPSGVPHFATMPPALARRCIVAGSRQGDVVLDPFNGVGTTGMVALQEGRRYLGVELNADYASLSVQRWHARAAQLVMPVAGGERCS